MSAPTVPEPPTPCQYPDPIPGIIPFGTLTIFAGAPGVGKTTMLAEWCARWRDGRTICGYSTNAPTAFYFLAADRQWSSHQRWFDAVGFSDIPHYSLTDDRGFDIRRLGDPKQAYDVFSYALDHLKPIAGSHLLVDPMSPLFICGDPNRARDVAQTLIRFSRVCADASINMTCTAHFGKQKGTDDQYTRPQDRIAGSGAFSGFSDTQMYLVDPQPPGTPYHTLGWVPRHAKAQEFRFTRDETTGLFSPFELYAELDRRDDAYSQIPETPTETCLIVTRIAQQLQLGHTQAQEYFYALVRDGRVTKVRRGLYQRAKPC